MTETRIGLIGFFGWGNFGDELFVEAHRQKLGHLGVVEPINDMTAKPYFTDPTEEVVARYDALVIGGGDLLVPWTVSDLYWRMEYLKKPVFVCGIGVPTWRKEREAVVERYRRFFSSENVRFIAARDPESRDWITKKLQPAAEVHSFADIVCAMDLPIPDAVPDDKILGIVLRHRKSGPDDFRYVRALCDRANMLGFKVEHIVLGAGEVGTRDYETASTFAQPDEPVRRSENVMDMCRFISRCTMVASMKFHGTVVATMYGIPSVVLSPTNKSRNFLKMIERPDLKSAINDKDLRHRITKYPAPISSLVRERLSRSASRGYEELEKRILSALS